MNEGAKVSLHSESFATKPVYVLIGVLCVLLIINQFFIIGISGSFVKKIEKVDISQIKSTAQTLASVFPLSQISDEQDAIDMLIAQGTPDYGESMGVSYDDPVGSLEKLAGAYPTVKKDVQTNNPEVWDRYLNLATKPVGISCEYCCGIGPVGITNDGELRCGCSHNPAIQTLTLLLMKDTDMSDAEVLQEAMKWKTLWFPRDMVGLALKTAGGDIETDLPGMVGGC